MLNFWSKANLRLFVFTLLKLPMVAYCRPRLMVNDAHKTVVRIQLRRRTKNHLRSMYLGAFAVGADITAGFAAFDKASQMGIKVSLAFKDFHADYYQRAMGDVHFECSDGELVTEMLNETNRTGERLNKPVVVTATCPSISDELVAKFTLTLSVRKVDTRR